MDGVKARVSLGKTSFILTQKNGVSQLDNFNLSGAGFSADGSLTLDKTGLRKAKLRNVVLNKTDDFDLVVSRKKGGYDASLDARSYDGRALIRSYVKSDRAKKSGDLSVNIKGRIGRLIGFGGQSLSGVSPYSQRGTKITKAVVKAVAEGNAPTIFALSPATRGMRTEISTSNAGSVLRFLDLYSKVRGGTINAKLVRDGSQVYRGTVIATNFMLLGEPRLAKLLQKPQPRDDIRNGEQVVQQLRKIPTDRVKVDRLRANIEKGTGIFNVAKGQLSGGDASAAFSGTVYDRNNRMKITGTYLPGRALNKLVSSIPIIGLAFGSGKRTGLLGITFKLSGRYDNPGIQVNPLSLIAPGVFRQLFQY